MSGRTSRARSAAALLVVALSGGCITVHRPWFMEPTLDRDWDSTLLLARVRANEGKFAETDSLLAVFSERYRGTREANEATYWRGLFDLDPSNHSSSFASAVASFDTYLADKGPRDHVAEAATLRRIAGHMDELNKLAAAALAEAKDTTTASVTNPDTRAETKPAAAGEVAPPTAADLEIKRLKDELAKANAELDRIKRRLAQPPPP